MRNSKTRSDDPERNRLSLWTASLRTYGRALLGLARLHWVLAVSEISKGLLIVVVGDLVIADELGALLESRLTELNHLPGALAMGTKWRRV